VKPDKDKLAGFSAEIDSLGAELKRPIVLEPASGDWVTAREAKEIIQKICGVGSDDAIRAICRRAVIVIPVQALTWGRSEDPHDYINRFDYFRGRENDLSHFHRTISCTAFSEICGFFEVLETAARGGDCSGIEHANWQTGDFKLTVERDFSDVTFTIIGLQFDKVALRQSFAGVVQTPAPEPLERASARKGRPPSPAWPDWIAELVAYIHEHGFPAGEGSQGQEALITAIADRLAERGLESPSRATVQAAARSVLDRLRSLEG
jgi:hypothetical protein